MKVLLSAICLFLLTAAASGQSVAKSPVASDVIVIQKSWRAEIFDPALTDEDPFQANNELKQSERDTKENIRQNKIRAQSGVPLEAPPPSRPQSSEKAVGAPSAGYIYQVKIKNNGEKTIQAIGWEYVFFESGTKQEVGRQRFESKISLQPGKIKSLAVRSASPPSGSINAASAGKKLRDQYYEEIIIRSLRYSDGSVWQAAAASSPK